MSIIITEISNNIISSGANSVLRGIVNFTPILLLIILLVQKEMIRTQSGKKKNEWFTILDPIIGSLILLFGFIILFRFLTMMNVLS